MYLRLKDHIYIISLFFFVILSGCQIKESTNNHGILFLENRANKLKINETNKNDVIKLIGIPHSKSINNDDILKLKSTLTKYKGSSPVYFDIHDSKNEFKLNMISEDTRVNISKELLSSLEEDEFLYKLN